MADHYFGFRDTFTGEVDDEPIVWIDWDFALVHALQVIEDNTAPSGLLRWEEESPRIRIEASKKIDQFEAAKARITGKGNYKPENGEYFVPVTTLLSGDEPTYRSWITDKVEKAIQGAVENSEK